jgi:hypothetical protein
MNLRNIIKAAFPGRLLYNASEAPTIQHYFYPDFSVPDFLYDVFDHAIGDGDTCTPQDWVCQDCLTGFLSTHTMIWWLERQRAGTRHFFNQCSVR